MNELDKAAMEAFIDRNGYVRLDREVYKRELIYYFERREPVGSYISVFWSAMGMRRHISCPKASTQEDRIEVARRDVHQHIDAKIEAAAEPRMRH